MDSHVTVDFGKMRYLFEPKFLDKIEAVIELLIMAALIIAAFIKFNADLVEAAFYVAMAAIIAPFSGIDKSVRRLLLLGGFFLGLFVGYFKS